MERDGFVQRAEGTFSVILAPHTPHCGPQQSDEPLPATFNYGVEMVYDPEALDGNEFLLDNTDFQAYFDGLKDHGPISHSCEHTVREAAEYFCGLLGERRGHCLEVRVRLWMDSIHVAIEYAVHPAAQAANA